MIYLAKITINNVPLPCQLQLSEYWEVCVVDGARCDPIYQKGVALILINASAFKKNLEYDSKSNDRSLCFYLKLHVGATFYITPGTEATHVNFHAAQKP